METPSPAACEATVAATATRPKPFLPSNYVTLKQLQELRLKEKQDEEERRLRELEEAREKKKAAEVEEVGTNPRRGPQLLPAVPKGPSEYPGAEKARSLDRSRAREKKSAKQRPPKAAGDEEVRGNPPRGLQQAPAVTKRPSPSPEAGKTCDPDRSHPAVEVAVDDKNTDSEPLGRPRRKRYDKKKKKKKENGKRGPEEETATGSEPMAPVPPPVIPIVPEKNLLKGKHRAAMDSGGSGIERPAAVTAVDSRIAGAETGKRTSRWTGKNREWASGGSGRRNSTSGRGSGPNDGDPVMVWVRKTKPSEP